MNFKGLLTISLTLFAGLLYAQTTYNYNTNAAANWSAIGAPGVGDIVNLSADLTAGRIITMNPAGTVGTLLMEDTVTATGSVFGWTIAGTALQTLTFDNTGATAATITVRNNTNAATGLVGGNMVISAPIVLNDDLIVNVADLGSFLTISGTINGGGKTLSILGLGGATIGTAAITNLAGVTIGSVHRATTISGSNTRTGSGEGYALNVSNLAGVTHSGAVTLNAGNINIAAENYGTLTMSGALTTSGNLTITGTGGLSKSVYTDNPTRSNTVAEKSLVRLTAVNALTGNTSISGASVLLSFTANNTANGRLSSAGTLTLGNAGLVMDGNVAASSSQAVTGTTLTDRSGNFVIVNRGNAGPSLGAVNATLNLGTITPGVESSVNFLTVSGTNGSGTTGGALIKVSNPNTNNMLGPWATTGTPGTIGGNVLNWAAKDGSGNVVDATYTTTTTTTFAGVSDATQNTNWTSTDTAVITLSGNITANSLKLATSRNSVSGVNLGTNTITLTSGGLILTNVSANPPASTLPYATWALTRLDNTTMTIQTSGSGLISAATPGTPLYIYANRPTYLSNPVVGDATGRLVKGGSGSLFLSAASTMAGVTIVGGELVLTGAATLATGNLSLNNGGTLIQEGTLTRNIGSASGQVSIGVGGGGFAARREQTRGRRDGRVGMGRRGHAASLPAPGRAAIRSAGAVRAAAAVRSGSRKSSSVSSGKSGGRRCVGCRRRRRRKRCPRVRASLHQSQFPEEIIFPRAHRGRTQSARRRSRCLAL